jgi:homoserine dehydrogenase
MSKPAVVNIGFCGLGTVGQGVWKHLSGSRALLEARLGTRLELYRVAVRHPGKARAVEIPAEKLTTDPLAIATDPAVPIVCELIGGTTLAREVTLAALAAGKIVVSANKALICESGAEIFKAARKGGGHFFFEASVAGGVPIIKALREGLVANRFKRIYGILNGTCNYILTRTPRMPTSWPTPNGWAMPRPTKRSTCRVGTPPTRRRCWPSWPTGCG